MSIKILVRVPDDVIHGVIPFVAERNVPVVLNPAAPSELLLANNVRGAYLLDRPSVPEIPLEEHVFNQNFVTPVKVGLQATATRVRTIEVEGAEFLIQSGTGAVSSGTAAQTELEWFTGKLRVRQGTNAIAGKVDLQLPPEEGAGPRLRVTLVD